MGALGVATSASFLGLFIGNGVWTTNASGYTKNNINVSEVSQVVSNPELPFQIIRQV